MNKQELIERVAENTELSKADAGRAVDAIFSAIIDTLKAGDQVSLGGVGVFQIKHRAARSGRNPQTGETIQIAASNSIGFKASKAWKDAVN